jgi:hypothetical protein
VNIVGSSVDIVSCAIRKLAGFDLSPLMGDLGVRLDSHNLAFGSLKS